MLLPHLSASSELSGVLKPCPKIRPKNPHHGPTTQRSLPRSHGPISKSTITAGPLAPDPASLQSRSPYGALTQHVEAHALRKPPKYYKLGNEKTKQHPASFGAAHVKMPLPSPRPSHDTTDSQLFRNIERTSRSLHFGSETEILSISYICRTAFVDTMRF